jgi:hypothetical protein
MNEYAFANSSSADAILFSKLSEAATLLNIPE